MKKPLGTKRAEKVGFEPTVRYKRTLVFKTSAISQTLPLLHNALLINSLLSPLFLYLYLWNVVLVSPVLLAKFCYLGIYFWELFFSPLYVFLIKTSMANVEDVWAYLCTLHVDTVWVRHYFFHPLTLFTFRIQNFLHSHKSSLLLGSQT